MDFYGYNAEEKKTFSASIVMDFYGYNAEEKKTFSASIVFLSFISFLQGCSVQFNAEEKKTFSASIGFFSYLIFFNLISSVARPSLQALV